MVTPDRIRLTGLLRKKPCLSGLFLWTRFAGDSSGTPGGELTAVSVEPPGAVARRVLWGRAGNEPLRSTNGNTDDGHGRDIRPPAPVLRSCRDCVNCSLVAGRCDRLN